MERTSYRNLMLGGGTAVGIVIALALVIALQYIAVKNPKRWDLTQSGIHTLAPQSKKVLDTFRDKNIPISVLAFYETKDTAQKEKAEDLLAQYGDVYPQLTYSFTDPDQNRTLALKNSVDTYPTILIDAGGKVERISAINEENVTNSLVKLLRTDVKKIYFLKGHGELSLTSTEPDGFAESKAHIERQNYKTEELVLLQTPEIPSDATVLVVAGPKTDPMDPELESIKSYLTKGGSLFVMLNPFKTPKLAGLLKDYGIETANDIIIDKMSRVFGGDYLIPVITTYINFPITKDFNLASFFPQARSIFVSKKQPQGITAQELALTSPVSWTITEEQLNSGNVNFDEKIDRQGPISVMAVSQMAVTPEAKETGQPKDETTPEQISNNARIVVTGSALFASNKFVQAIQANKEMLLNSISWLAADANLISIRPKSLKAQPLILTGNEPLTVFIIPMVFMPFLWIVIGIAVYVYRKRVGMIQSA